MKSIEIEGDRVPALGFGTWELTGRTCREAVADALAIGYRHIDTAQGYDNEEEVGRAIAESDVDRTGIFVTTKIAPHNLDFQRVLRSTEESLRRLRTDYIDLLLIHWPNPEVPLEESLGAMMRLKDEGRIRHIGVSNFSIGLLTEALRLAPVVCNQVKYHPLLDQGEMLEFVRHHGLMLTAYSPLGRGHVRSEPVLQEIGRRHDREPAQVALRWLMQQERVAAIPKAADPDHRRSNLRIFDFELSPEEMERIASLSHLRV